MGEHQDPGVHFVMVEEKRNILIGCVLVAFSQRNPETEHDSGPPRARVNSLGIFVGFATFFFMEKTLRVLGGEGEGPGHSHSHSHVHDTNHTITKAETTALKASTSENGLRSRKGEQSTNGAEASPEPAAKPSGPSKLSAYLNLFGDFVHNM